MQLFTAVLEGSVAFFATNIDDLFILMMFFAQVNGSLKKRQIVVGQYLGFAALLIISGLGFCGTLVVPQEWIGLLGLVPMAMGVRKLIRRRETIPQTEKVASRIYRVPNATTTSVFSSLFSPQTYGVATVTFANGGDNIGIYVPLFASGSLGRMGVIMGVFLVLIGVWCHVGFKLVQQPIIAQVLARYGHIVMPLVLIGLGIYILVENDTWRLFTQCH